MACLSGTWQEWMSLLWLSCSPCAMTKLIPFNTPCPEKSASYPAWWHWYALHMEGRVWNDQPLTPHWGPSASCCTCGAVPGFAWTGVVLTICISHHVAEMGTNLLLRQAWSQGSYPTPARKVGVPTCVLLFTLPRLPDVSQGHGHGPTPLYPYRDAVSADGCEWLFCRYRTTRHILLAKPTLFGAKRPHS